MPQKLSWTAPADAQLRDLRAQGACWADIAAVLGLSRNAALERGRRIGARLPPRPTVLADEDAERPCLPPGHPVTWGALTAGTLLEATPYPWPSCQREPGTQPERGA